MPKQYPHWLLESGGNWARTVDRSHVGFVDLPGGQGLLGQVAGRNAKVVVDWLTNAHDVTSFTFLGHTFRPRLAKNRWGKHFVNFLPAVSKGAIKAMGQTIRSWHIARRSDKSLGDLARMFNSIVLICTSPDRVTPWEWEAVRLGTSPGPGLCGSPPRCVDLSAAAVDAAASR